jgi:MFS transporter, SP family, general alpha glucoside:H+ symporter
VNQNIDDFQSTIGFEDEQNQGIARGNEAGRSGANSSANNHDTTRFEHNLSILHAFRIYPKACFWSIFFSLGIIMCAFDAQLLGSLYATPAFQHDFGYEFNGRYIISAPWQMSLSMGGPIGQVVGAFFASYPLERYGRKVTFGACVILTSIIVAVQFLARSLEMLLIGELFGGLVLGTYATIAPTYASEVCPVALRGILTSYINLCFVMGQLFANITVACTSKLDTHWAYSAPFAAQWLWPVIILIGLPFAPESPWWLVRRGRLKEAQYSLERLTSSEIDVGPTLSMIVDTDSLEQKIEAGSTYADCFSPSNFQRTEISIGVYAIQVLSGTYLVGYATYFFELAGLPVEQAFNMSVAFLALGFLGTCMSWILLSQFGRRIIYIFGLAALIVLLVAIGVIDCIPGYSSKPALPWAQASLMLAWNFTYDLTIGPICFVIICEVSATRVRAKTIAIATAVQALLGVVMTIAVPFLFNPDQASARGKIAFLFAVLGSLGLLWSWKVLIETKDMTFKELDEMFASNAGTAVGQLIRSPANEANHGPADTT